MFFMASIITKDIVSEEKKVQKAFKKNPWKIISCVLIIAVLILAGFMIKGKTTTGSAVKLVEVLNEQVKGGVTLVNVSDLGNVYQVNVLYQGKDIPVYMTKDGKYMIAGLSEIDYSATPANVPSDNSQASVTGQVTKSDKPQADLFVMTYCPYGTQSEKGIIPAIEALGTKADVTIRFVHYFMHGDKEEQETYTQVCIREEQSTKFLSYLKCFLNSSDSSACIKSTGIDSAKLATCVFTKAKDYYKVDSDLSNQYGVQGSPTLIINGAESSAGRSSVSYLSGICAAFNNAPSECSTSLSSSSPSPGFGYGTSGAATSASCG